MRASPPACAGIPPLLALLLLAGFSGAAAGSEKNAQAPAEAAVLQPQALAERFGIALQPLRLTAAGRMIDLRYRVVDAEKAEGLLGRQSKPYLIDEKGGVHLATPSFPKVGSLRQTRSPLYEGRIYFALFATSERRFAKGDTVTLAVGDFRIPGLRIE